METWEVWFPAAAANGLLVARARINPTDVLGSTRRPSCYGDHAKLVEFSGELAGDSPRRLRCRLRQCEAGT